MLTGHRRAAPTFVAVLAALALVAGGTRVLRLGAEPQQPPPPIAAASAQALAGAIDIHVHAAPDNVARSIDALDVAALARTRGMRAIVLKNHYESTAALAYLARKQSPGLEVFGGIDLNLTVGGMNPAAVEHMTQMTGHWGRLVWMSTFDAENQVRYSKENRPFVSVARNGQLLPETREVIVLAAKHNLMLETGHSSAAECLTVIREARRAGVKNVVVTHAAIAPIHMSVAQMKEAAALGAWIEFVYNALIGPNKEFTAEQYASMIREVGPAHCILSSDLGQAVNPVHTTGWVAYLAALEKAGVRKTDLELMSRTNPAQALGLQ